MRISDWSSDVCSSDLLRGGKYSAFEAGTRVPFIVHWPGKVQPGVSDALFSQVDLLASFAQMTGVSLDSTAAPDSFDHLDALLGETKEGRSHEVENALNGTLQGVGVAWKSIEPNKGPELMKVFQTETGSQKKTKRLK